MLLTNKIFMINNKTQPSQNHLINLFQNIHNKLIKKSLMLLIQTKIFNATNIDISMNKLKNLVIDKDLQTKDKTKILMKFHLLSMRSP